MTLTVPHPAAGLVFVGTRLGSAAVKAACTGAVAGRLTPEILGEALVSSASVRAHLQAEALQFVAVRISMRSPQRLAWLMTLLTDCVATGSATGGVNEAVRRLSRRAALAHVTAFGMKGTVASAMAALVVQTGMLTCQLASTNVRPLLSPAEWRLWRQRRKADQQRRRALRDALTDSGSKTREALQRAAADEEEQIALRRAWEDQACGMSLKQYRYSVVTAILTATGSVVGSGVGAAVGTCVMPGFGTVIGSMVASFSVGYLPAYVRDGKGPDDCRREQVRELRRYQPSRMADTEDGFVELLPRPGAIEGSAAKADDDTVTDADPITAAAAAAAAVTMTEDPQWHDLLDEEELDVEDSVLVLRARSYLASNSPATNGSAASLSAQSDETSAPSPPTAIAAVKANVWPLSDYLPPFLTAPARAPAVGTSSACRVRAPTRPTSSEWSDIDDAAAPHAAAMGTVVARDGEEGAPTAAARKLGSNRDLTVLGGKMELLPPHIDWAALDKHMDQLGEDELVLVFHKT